MATFSFTINKRSVRIETEPQMPLLWVIRDLLGLTGTKYGMGQGIWTTLSMLIAEKLDCSLDKIKVCMD